MMKKVIAVFLSLALMASLALTAEAAEEKTIRVVTTIFPIYDWVREISGDNSTVELTMLLDNGVDLHSYQPTAADIMKIATCDVFIHVGGESDEWVEDALQEAVNKDMIVVNLVDAMGEDIKTEEIVEGMEHEHDEDEEHEHGEAHAEDGDHDHDHEEEADEHVWLSLRNAQKLAGAISEALAQADPAHGESFRANAAAYCEKLAALDREYSQAVETASFKTLVFGDRFPFRYLTDDYGLAYYAAFAGCSAETEASFRTIVFLAQKTDELGLPAVMTIEGAHHKIAETIVENTSAKDQKILTLNSMQGTTTADVQSGATYLSIMEENLDVLKQAIH